METQASLTTAYMMLKLLIISSLAHQSIDLLKDVIKAVRISVFKSDETDCGVEWLNFRAYLLVIMIDHDIAGQTKPRGFTSEPILAF